MAEIDLLWPQAFPLFEGDALRAFEIRHSAILALAARKGACAQLVSVIGGHFGITPPEGLTCKHKSGLTIIATAPDTWLCVKDEGGSDWAAEVADLASGVGSVVDQSGAYVRVRMEGEKARAVLQKGAYLDLNPEVFGPGAAAQASIAHVNVLLWRSGGDFAYDLAVPRSYIQSFSHWLAVAAR